MSDRRAKIAKKASKLLEAQAEMAEEPKMDGLPVEELKEEEKEEGDLKEKLDELTSKVDSLAAALEQLITMEEEEGHEDLEDLKEEEEEKKDDEVSKDEMGLEEPELAAKAEKTDLGDHNKTIADDFEKDKSDKAQQKLEAPAPQITKVKKSELPEMLKLADIAFEQKNDKWIVIDASDESNEKPVYEISKGSNGDNFSTSEFVEGLIKQMQADGVEAVLQSVGAVEYAGEEKKDEKPVDPNAPKVAPTAPPAVAVAEKKEEKKPEEKVDVPVVKASDVQRKFARCFTLAITAMNKNLVENPLKKALGSKLDDLGVEESEIVRIVETVFKEAANDHFATALAQTEKYMAMSDEAFVETESMIRGLNTAEPVISASQRRVIEEEARDLRARASRGSIPVTTSSESTLEKRDLLSQALPKPANLAKKDLFRKLVK